MSAKIQCKKRGSLNIKYAINTKLPFAQIVITWETTEKSLLRAILRKFISEKVITKGINYRNNIISACVGMSGIMFICTETKFFAIISQLYNALFTSEVKIQGNYSKLISDINKGCTIYCTGRIKNIIKHLSNNSTKIDKFKTLIDSYESKNRNKESNHDEHINSFKLAFTKRYKGNEKTFNENDKYALALLLSNSSIDFWFENDWLYTNDLNLLIEVLTRINFSLIKAFKFRFSKNDNVSFKFTSEMFAALYNFKNCSGNFDKCASKLKYLAIPPMI